MTHVTFSGIDGCGKSTQIDQLVERYEREGKRPVRLWSRGGYTEGMLLAKKVARRLMGKQLAKPGHSDQRKKAFGNPLTARLWLTAAIVDLIRVYGINIRVWQLMGRPVVCDRYLWDTLVDFQMLFDGIDVERMTLWRLLSFVASAPDEAFLLDLSPEVAEVRALAKGDPWPEPLAARQDRQKRYERLKERGIFTVVDASATLPDVSDAVTRVLEKSP
jgi:thymidylate kinase